MAGGNINLQLNEDLCVYTRHSTDTAHQNGEIAISMSYTSYYNLAYPIFNLGSNYIQYTAICIYFCIYWTSEKCRLSN